MTITSQPRVRYLIGACIGLTIFTACSSEDLPARAIGSESQVASDGGQNEVSSRAQESDGTAVVIDRVQLDERGYVVVYETRNGAPSTVIGSSPILDSGEYLDLQVDLDDELASSADVFVILHGERNGNSTLEHPGPDEPISSSSGIVAISINVALANK